MKNKTEAEPFRAGDVEPSILRLRGMAWAGLDTQLVFSRVVNRQSGAAAAVGKCAAQFFSTAVDQGNAAPRERSILIPADDIHQRVGLFAFHIDSLFCKVDYG